MGVMGIEFAGIHDHNCPAPFSQDHPGILRSIWNYRKQMSLFPLFDLPAGSTDSPSFADGMRRLVHCKAIVDYATAYIPKCNEVYEITEKLIRHWLIQHISIIVRPETYSKHKVLFHEATGSAPVKSQSFGVTGRQAGKTTGLAIVIAAVMCCADEGPVFKIYSRNQKQSAIIIEDIKHVLKNLPSHLAPKIKVDNATSIGIVPRFKPMCTELCSVAARPGLLDSVRGDKAEAIIIDEFLFIEIRFFNRHIRPLMSHMGRLLTCISTPAALRYVVCHIHFEK